MSMSELAISKKKEEKKKNYHIVINVVHFTHHRYNIHRAVPEEHKFRKRKKHPPSTSQKSKNKINGHCFFL